MSITYNTAQINTYFTQNKCEFFFLRMNRVVQSEIKGNWFRIMLNRPKSLNAVNTEIAQYGIYDLVNNVLNENVKGVIAGGIGRAVAAGGDVR